MAKINTAAEASTAIQALTPAKIELLIKGLRAQHPHLRHAKDSEIRAMLRNFVQRNG